MVWQMLLLWAGCSPQAVRLNPKPETLLCLLQRLSLLKLESLTGNMLSLVLAVAISDSLSWIRAGTEFKLDSGLDQSWIRGGSYAVAVKVDPRYVCMHL